MMGLEGKRVVVTAGGAGIGRAIAAAFLEAGARVLVCDREPAHLAEAAAALSGLETEPADVTRTDDVASLFAAADRCLGGLDVLINNAGIAGPTGPVEDCTTEGWRETLAVNLDGAFYCARQAVPRLKAAGGGAIVNMSSTAGLFGYPLRAPYVAAKWALIGFTKTLAMELGPHGIRVNAVCPGAVEGPRMDRVIAAEAKARGLGEGEVRAAYARQVSLRRFVTAEEIAESVRFLCSEQAAMISGQAITVDGHTESLS